MGLNRVWVKSVLRSEVLYTPFCFYRGKVISPKKYQSYSSVFVVLDFGTVMPTFIGGLHRRRNSSVTTFTGGDLCR